jgi:hypothetical protein
MQRKWKMKEKRDRHEKRYPSTGTPQEVHGCQPHQLPGGADNQLDKMQRLGSGQKATWPHSQQIAKPAA